MNCKVIATSIGSGRQVRTTAPFPNHNQDEATADDVMNMLSIIIGLEKKQDAGVPCDILVVNSSDEGHEFIESLAGSTKNGLIRSFSRKNVGGSFGAFNYAYKHFPEYDYWLLTEDDIVVFGDDYYRKLITKFETYENMGMLALIDVQEQHPLGIHAHGAVGLTKKRVLDAVWEYNEGVLPHYRGAWDKKKVIARGEVPFTRSMHELGFQLDVFSSSKEWRRENLCLPYYEFKKFYEV